MQSGSPEDPISAEIQALQRPLRGRRWLSWLSFVGMLATCLFLPMVASMLPAWNGEAGAKGNNGMITETPLRAVPPASDQNAPAAAHAAASRSVGNSTFLHLDGVWNPGPMSGSHRLWAKDCKACHSTPFVRVQDADCRACHNAIGDHVDRAVSTVGTLHDVRCASCHRDHKGEFGLIVQNRRYTEVQCAACHAHIGQSFAATATQDVTDFAKDHPAFRVQLLTGSDQPMLARIRQPVTGWLSERTALKFPHDAHMQSTGVNSPTGKVNMNCNDCHRPNADRSGFLPISMKDHCQSCHALKFEPAVSNREVPHGSVDQVLSTLREFYSYVGLNGVPLDGAPAKGPIFQLRPGRQPAMASYVKSTGDARQKAAGAAIQLFEKTSCIICHQVTRVAGPGRSATPGQDLPQWRIAPVSPRHAWLPKAEFSHAKHATAQCVNCHRAPSSKLSSDVMMPSIRDCRTCHTGNRPKKGKITSDCALCHGFHHAAKTVTAVRAEPSDDQPEEGQ